MLCSDNASANREGTKLWVCKVMQDEDKLKFTKVSLSLSLSLSLPLSFSLSLSLYLRLQAHNLQLTEINSCIVKCFDHIFVNNNFSEQFLNAVLPLWVIFYIRS